MGFTKHVCQCGHLLGHHGEYSCSQYACHCPSFRPSGEYRSEPIPPGVTEFVHRVERDRHDRILDLLDG